MCRLVCVFYLFMPVFTMLQSVLYFCSTPLPRLNIYPAINHSYVVEIRVRSSAAAEYLLTGREKTFTVTRFNPGSPARLRIVAGGTNIGFWWCQHFVLPCCREAELKFAGSSPSQLLMSCSSQSLEGVRNFPDMLDPRSLFYPPKHESLLKGTKIKSWILAAGNRVSR